MPYLSVLLPARNAAATVEAAVRSTLRCLPPDAEVVVLDDGSSDSTFKVLEGISSKKLRIIRGSGSGNLGAALNHLLCATDSEIIARMDADDVTLPGRFRSSLRAVGRGADLTFTSAVTTGGRVRVRPSMPLPIDGSAFPFHLLLSNPVRHPSLTARRAAIEALGGYRELPSEDYDLWLRAAVAGSTLTKSSAYGLAYRVHPGQITADASWRHLSRTDTQMQEVYSVLSSRLLGRPFPRLVALEGMQDEEATETIAVFQSCFRREVARLPSAQRLYLLAKLRRRTAEITRSVPSQPRGGGMKA